MLERGACCRRRPPIRTLDISKQRVVAAENGTGGRSTNERRNWNAIEQRKVRKWGDTGRPLRHEADGGSRDWRLGQGRPANDDRSSRVFSSCQAVSALLSNRSSPSRLPDPFSRPRPTSDASTRAISVRRPAVSGRSSPLRGTRTVAQAPDLVVLRLQHRVVVVVHAGVRRTARRPIPHKRARAAAAAAIAALLFIRSGHRQLQPQRRGRRPPLSTRCKGSEVNTCRLHAPKNNDKMNRSLAHTHQITSRPDLIIIGAAPTYHPGTVSVWDHGYAAVARWRQTAAVCVREGRRPPLVVMSCPPAQAAADRARD